MNLSRLHRLLQLIGLLQAGRGYDAPALACACQVSRRTIYRDLDLLQSAGLPLHYDSGDQCYRLPVRPCLPPTSLTTEEALALIVLCHELGAREGVPFLGPAHSAAVKLESNLPLPIREYLRSVSRAVEILPPPANPMEGQAEVYQQLLEAIAARRCVRIHYHSVSERSDIVTRLSPYRLLFSRRSWYAIGRSSLHRDTRTFNVARVRRLERLDDTYRIPRGFSVDRYLGNAWHLIPEPGPDQEVLIRFRPMVAQNVAEVAWHKTQRVQFNEDGSLDFRATVSGLQEISWWILGYGDQAEVIAPVELRQLVARRAASTAAQYGPSLAAAAGIQ